MQFSSRLPVAVHILLAILKFGETEKITSNFLAESININPVVVRNVLTLLKQAGLIDVKAGVGGASLKKKPEEITLLDIFSAVEKDENLFPLNKNPNPNCPVGRNINTVLDENFENLKNTLRDTLSETTLLTMYERLETIIKNE